MDEGTRDRLIKLTEYENQETRANSTFLRNIATISSGMLGLLVGLRPETIPNQYSKGLYLASLVLISLGILFVVISLHYEVSLCKQQVKAQKQMLSEYIQTGKDYQHVELPKSLIYRISEPLSFFCLILSIVTLILYVSFLP